MLSLRLTTLLGRSQRLRISCSIAHLCRQPQVHPIVVLPSSPPSSVHLQRPILSRSSSPPPHTLLHYRPLLLFLRRLASSSPSPSEIESDSFIPGSDAPTDSTNNSAFFTWNDSAVAEASPTVLLAEDETYHLALGPVGSERSVSDQPDLPLDELWKLFDLRMRTRDYELQSVLLEEFRGMRGGSEQQ